MSDRDSVAADTYQHQSIKWTCLHHRFCWIHFMMIKRKYMKTSIPRV